MPRIEGYEPKGLFSVLDAVNGVREDEKWGGGKHCMKVYGLKTRGRKKRNKEGE